MAKRKVVLYDICGRPIKRFAPVQVSVLNKRYIGNHLMMCCEYDDPNDDGMGRFFGVSLDCVIQHRGTQESCGVYWRALVRCLNAAEKRNAERRDACTSM